MNTALLSCNSCFSLLKKTTKQLTVFTLLSITFHNARAQGLAVNTTGTPALGSAMLDVSSNEKGVLIPRMTTAQRTAIIAPATSLLVFDTDLSQFAYYTGTEWTLLASGTNTWTISGTNQYSNVAGNVGIGTAAPGEKLEVAGNIRGANIYANTFLSTGPVLSNNLGAVATFNTNANAPVLVGEPSNNKGLMLGYDGSDIQGRSGVNFIFNSDLTINRYGGNVGIGTATPAEKLDINGTTKTTGFQLTTGAVNGYVLQSDAAGVGNWVNPATLPITENDPQISSALNNMIPKWNGSTLTDGIITDNGTNIGIGTAAPSAKLHVIGSVKIDAGKLPFVNTGGSVFIGDNAGVNDDLTNNNNVFVGDKAGQNNTTGDSNTFIGSNAGKSNTTGTINTALGISALDNNTTGVSNVALGRSALSGNTTGTGNVGVGTSALQFKTTGSNNTAVGTNSLISLNSGNYNVSIGAAAGNNNLTGSLNVFLGSNAGYNETGSNKLYIDNSSTSTPLIYGNFAADSLKVNGTLTINNAYTLPNTAGTVNYVLQTNGTGQANWVNPATAFNNSQWGLSGNSGTTPGTNFIGTTDAQPLILKVNNQQSGYISYASPFTTAYGYKALSASTGISNAAFGFLALAANTTGYDNYAFGDSTLSNNTSGYHNVGVGTLALYSNTTGLGNTAIGFASLQNFTGTLGVNTAIGDYAMAGSISGNNNCAMGVSALRYNTNGSDNIAIGRTAVSGTTGSFNTGIGSNALGATATNNNTAIGYDALSSGSTGANNTALGASTDYTGTGSNNTIIGYNGTGRGSNNTLLGASSSVSLNSISNATAVGYNVSLTTSNTVILGNGAAVGIGTSSPTQAMLVINGSNASNFTSYGYLNRTTPTGTYNGAAVSANYSIYASDRIAATEFNAYSDARIKNIKGITNNAEDLNTISKIEITNYSLKDVIAKGNGEYKKIIAQQVEKVYPQAVTKTTDFIPDMYKQAEIKNGFITMANTLKTGDKVKLIFESGEEIVTVTAAGASSFTVDKNKTGKVFVFGKQVNDFRTVDYEALSTLNISATQQLIKLNQQQQKIIEVLEARLQSLEQKLNCNMVIKE